MMFARSIRAFVCALVALGATAVMARAEDLVCTENRIRVDGATESAKLAQ